MMDTEVRILDRTPKWGDKPTEEGAPPKNTLGLTEREIRRGIGGERKGSLSEVAVHPVHKKVSKDRISRDRLDGATES